MNLFVMIKLNDDNLIQEVTAVSQCEVIQSKKES